MEGPFSHQHNWTAWYTYGFVPGTGQGVLYLGKNVNVRVAKPLCPVYVLSGIEDDSLYEVEGILHPNLLNCMFVNRELKHIVFESPSIKLGKMKEIWITASHEGPRRAVLAQYRIPGTKAESSCVLIPPYRNLIRQLYKVVLHLHSLNYSFKRLTMEHLFMGCDGLLKVCGIGLYASKPPHTLKADFAMLISVVQGIVAPIAPTGQLVYPATLLDLIKETRALECKVLDGKLVNDGMFLYNHLALVPPSDTLAFIRALGEKLVGYPKSFLVDNNKVNFKVTVAEVLDEISKFDNWESFISGYEDVERCYYYRRQKMSEQKAKQEEKGKQEKGKGKGKENYYSARKKQALLKFMRNLAVHTPKLDAICLETTILHLYSKQILSAQAGMNKLNVFSAFMRL